MRRTLAITALAACIVAGGAAPALAANGNPQRPDGPVVPVQPSVNGGDNGWGNCGHNSSGGNPPTKAERGNGGYKKGDGCGTPTAPTDPTDPTDPTNPPIIIVL
ncbi:hypothetical protein [Aquipuribacter sp. MA13-6]|uniref:hypothetical protein n=1 Tax=unclassified Aquipuribacter TaxID=2635084 RepID=UPI003EE9B3B4